MAPETPRNFRRDRLSEILALVDIGDAFEDG